MSHIAILEADTPMPSVAEVHGSYGDIFKRLLLNAKLDPKSVIKAYDVVTKQEYPNSLDGVDAILITGSKHNAFGDDEWIIKLVNFTKQAIDAGIKVVGTYRIYSWFPASYS
ncbi:amidotransferase (predicted) [Sugiyamaella lignohabitans]|uniref:Amidotransferase (Predicted) n=1 Tax=Sugiyamaella lignohabitans TaxID=796027 RepID=A0A161HIT7_9ASCO|nr:amidotransferase (predicted) [Sugiyamaella lignohabitans]ANB11158.1 amidotransferase (predicted) [Sugiyamaella lignohabitans]